MKTPLIFNKERKEFKYDFPRIVILESKFSLLRKARFFMEEYTNSVFPALKTFGLLNDEIISQALASTSREFIYVTAMAINEQRIRLMEEIAVANNTDLWKCIRKYDCKVEKPYEEGFEFAPMPFANEQPNLRKLFVDSIKVENHKLFLDKKPITDACTYHPTNKQRELYDLLRDFCAELKRMGLKPDPRELLTGSFTYEYLRPNVENILYNHIAE